MSTCRKSVGLRDGTFFDKLKLSLQQWVVLMYWWICQYPVSDAAQEDEVQEKTAIQVYQYLRDICSWRLMSMLALGSPGGIVQIDESLFRHKPEVSEYNSEDKVLGLICNVF